MESILKKIIGSPEFVEGIAWKQRTFITNEVIVKQGELGETLFLIQSGILRVTGHVTLDEDKHIQPGLCDLKQGSLFGETCLHESSPRMATVIAVTEGTLIEVVGKHLSIFLDTNPALGYLLYKKMFAAYVSRLDKANQRVENLMAWGLKVHEIDKYLS